MKGVQAKGSHWVLACVLALMIAVAMALPALATADETPEVDKVGNASDVSVDAPEKQLETQGEPVVAEEAVASDETDAVKNEAEAQDEGDTADVELVAQVAGQSIDGMVLDIHGPRNLVPSKVEETTQSLYFRDWELRRGVDFEVAGYRSAGAGDEAPLSQDVPQVEGSYEMVVVGKGDYAGRATAQFTLVDPYSLENGFCFVECDEADFVRTGNPIEPTVTVRMDETTLEQGKDYVIAGYKTGKGGDSGEMLDSAPTEEGDYAVVINGAGDYNGTAYAGFTVYDPRSLSSNPRFHIEVAQSTYAYKNGDPVVPAVTVVLDGVALVQDRDFVIDHYVREEPGTSGIEVKNATTDGTYRVVIKAVEGSGYTGESDKASFSIVGQNDPAMLNDLRYATVTYKDAESLTHRHYTVPPTVEWDGASAAPPEIVVTSASGETLVEGKDYQVIFKKTSGSQGNQGGNQQGNQGGGQQGGQQGGGQGNNPQNGNQGGNQGNQQGNPQPGNQGGNGGGQQGNQGGPDEGANQQGNQGNNGDGHTGNQGYDENPFNHGWMTTMNGEGTYLLGVAALAGGKYTGSNTQGLTFFAATAEHDLTKATVTLDSSENLDFSAHYAGGAEITDALNEHLVVTLNGQRLIPNQDFYINHRSNDGRPGTGKLGRHAVFLTSSGAANGGGTYWGIQYVEYEVWNPADPTAPTATSRTFVDPSNAKRGVKAESSVDFQGCFNEDEEWMTLDAPLLGDEGLADEPAAKKAKDDAVANGAKDVQVYGITLTPQDASGAKGNPLEENLHQKFTFSVGEEFNDMSATITQIHGGEPLDPKNATVVNGEVVTDGIDRLSEFVIAIGGENAANNTTNENAGKMVEKPTDKASVDKDAKSKAPSTGDVVLPVAAMTLVVIAMVAAGVLTVSRKRSQR